MDRITLDRLALEEKLTLAIMMATRRRAAIMRGLQNPSTTPSAERNRDFSTRELARGIAEEFIRSGHEVTRKRGSDDAEGILTGVREKAEQRRLFDG